MGIYSFLATTYLLADVLPIIARLSKRFQRSRVDFATVTGGIMVTAAARATFKSTAGPQLEHFFETNSRNLLM